MEVRENNDILPLEAFDYKNKTVIVRIDINSPINPITKRIVNINRIKKSKDTLKYLIEQKAKLAIIAHQGDTLDYQNFIPMNEHVEILSKVLNKNITYIDDVCGPTAQKAVINLKAGEAVFLGNLRYLCEEVSTFEDYVKLNPGDMLDSYLVRSLAPLADYYVNDAFAAAHRNAPSMVAFQELLPSAGGRLLIKEIEVLSKILKQPKKPLVFLIGGLKVSDAYGMINQALTSGTADMILTCGLIGEIMLLAKGISIGKTKERFIKDKGLEEFIDISKECLSNYEDRIKLPIDLAYGKNLRRYEVRINDLPVNEAFMDIGSKTINTYKEVIENAGTIFVNGPVGAYENDLFSKGTKELLNAISDTKGYSIIGGGDTVNAASQLVDIDKFDYVCTGGGAMIRFLSGKKLPLIEAMKRAKNLHKIN